MKRLIFAFLISIQASILWGIDADFETLFQYGLRQGKPVKEKESVWVKAQDDYLSQLAISRSNIQVSGSYSPNSKSINQTNPLIQAGISLSPFDFLAINAKIVDTKLSAGINVTPFIDYTKSQTASDNLALSKNDYNNFENSYSKNFIDYYKKWLNAYYTKETANRDFEIANINYKTSEAKFALGGVTKIQLVDLKNTQIQKIKTLGESKSKETQARLDLLGFLGLPLDSTLDLKEMNIFDGLEDATQKIIINDQKPSTSIELQKSLLKLNQMKLADRGVLNLLSGLNIGANAEYDSKSNADLNYTLSFSYSLDTNNLSFANARNQSKNLQDAQNEYDLLNKKELVNQVLLIESLKLNLELFVNIKENISLYKQALEAAKEKSNAGNISEVQYKNSEIQYLSALQDFNNAALELKLVLLSF